MQTIVSKCKCFSMAPHIRSHGAPCSCFPNQVSLQLYEFVVHRLRYGRCAAWPCTAHDADCCYTCSVVCLCSWAWALQNRLKEWVAAWGVDSWRQRNRIRRKCILAPHARQRCRLVSDYFDHLLLLLSCSFSAGSFDLLRIMTVSYEVSYVFV